MIALLSLAMLGVESTAPAAALPRITVQNGRFVNSATRKEFHPVGFNYIRLRRTEPEPGNLWHDTLNPAHYSADRTERMFADLERRGFNIVRVFLDPLTGTGFVERAAAEELSAGYLRSLFDFLRRARAHHVYVMLCFCYLPDRTAYRVGPPPEHIEGSNQEYLHPGMVRSRAQWMADVCSAIRKHDPALLSTVFAYELENESHFIATQAPFSLTSGTVQWNGRTYDAASPDDLQRLADDAIVEAINAAHDAVRKVDRQALVGASVFTFRAVGRSGPGKIREDKTDDPRFPARPLAIARSKSAYVDVHFYPTDDTMLDADYRSIEFPALKVACEKAGKPRMVGEIGAFKFAYKDLPTAVQAMSRSLRRLREDGWQGFLYWTYDNEEQSDMLWEATAGDGSMLRMLQEVWSAGR